MFRVNPDFFLSRKGESNKIYFHHQNGARIRTDSLTAAIWSKADGRSLPQIYKAVGDEFQVSKVMIEAAVSIMVSAGLLEPIGGRGRSGSGGSPEIPEPAPLVSVVVVNYNGLEHLDDLFGSLADQSYPNIEIVMVDNASTDGSVDHVRRFWPEVKVVAQYRNTGFAAGNNAGIAAAAGDYLFLVNNDTKVDRHCVAALVDSSFKHPKAAAVAPKIKLFKLPGFINAVGNSVRPKGWGSDNFIGHVDHGQFGKVEEVFSACFGAVLICREAIESVGLLDGAYLFYYEDCDWSYRARLQGYKIYFNPDAVVYHKFNATMNTLSKEFKFSLIVGNRLRFALKNLALRPALAFSRNYLKEDILHFLWALIHGRARRVWTYIKGWTRLALMMPGIIRQRRKIQKKRLPAITDGELFKLLPDAATVALIDDDHNPVLNSKVIRQVYIHDLKPGTET